MGEAELVDLKDAFPEAGQLLEEARHRPGSTVATAESCTGGLLAAAITAVPGSSSYFLGGLVTYQDLAKLRELEVEPSILAAHGAVSEEVAGVMAAGVRRRFGSQFGVATTGVAGPGSSALKPAGLIYVAVSGPLGLTLARLEEDHGRHLNRILAVRTGLRLLLAAWRQPD